MLIYLNHCHTQAGLVFFPFKMIEYLKTIVSLGLICVFDTLGNSIRYLCFSGKGDRKFSSSAFYIQQADNLEHTTLSFSQDVESYDSDSSTIFFATNTYHYPNTDTNSTSENLCKLWLTDILNTLAPFLQERKTNFKTVIFSFCKEKADDSRYGYTTYQLNDLVIITFNMTKLKSKDLFCNVAIHEIVHMLTPFEGHGNNFYHTYICVLRILSTSLRNVTLFPASTFLSPSL